MPGFTNEGNTCWMNATLQCLLHVPQLVNFVRDEMFAESLVHKRKNACDFASAFAELAQKYWASGDVLSAADAMEAFMRVHRSFRGKRHRHDAGEALLLCMDTLHAAMGNVQKIDDHPVPFEGRPEETDAWEKHADVAGHSPIADIFTGQRKVGNEYEQFTSLALDPHATVEKSFEGLEFTRLPLILVVTLKKTEDKQFVGYGDELVLHDVAFQVSYKLFAVLMHHGSSAEGHWTALAQNRGAWKHFDDASETAVEDLNNIIQKDAVVLLYKRMLEQ